MVSLNVRVDQATLDVALERLGRLESLGYAELFDDLGEQVEQQTRDRFRDGVDPEGTPWEPSARVLADGGKTLIDTSRLMRSITHEASRRELIVGTNVEYAAAHQDPATGDSGRLKRPRRVFMGLSGANMDELSKVALEHLGVMA